MIWKKYSVASNKKDELFARLNQSRSFFLSVWADRALGNPNYVTYEYDSKNMEVVVTPSESKSDYKVTRSSACTTCFCVASFAKEFNINPGKYRVKKLDEGIAIELSKKIARH